MSACREFKQFLESLKLGLTIKKNLIKTIRNLGFYLSLIDIEGDFQENLCGHNS